MKVNQIIAQNLKKLRLERNFSLGQLAELSQVSKVMLSQIEKGDTNPTINTIWKIANGLKVPYTALLQQQEDDTVIVKKSEIAMQTGDDKHYRIFCYYPNTPQRNFELFQIELDAGYSYTSIGHSEKNQEYIMVLEGNLQLTVNNKTYDLHPDDTICFTASAKHIYTSNGAEELKAVIINFYPVT
ncbi:MAG: XRE family transcriptional regulator [Clostridiales bacterium]|jgi:transcriptional regulator with XRE-family HTH domain|nr:XRE family transcriptional regulator [Clostridiales bacterium]MCI2161960.1 XRE family transcriptional regulator [Oscillospiraceae bacterium]MCI1962327.1 XRE family transcriptional regulator [Clostridiales bacterium]MCI2022861.1 XRE family transcriptional regulator [Clostridiales bacterium]MCI2027258.1 XRE family transcriptional regulator [Clostridiales bacterium]